MTQKQINYWNKKRTIAAQWLAEGYTEQEAAEAAGISRRTICRWKKDLEFIVEVDRLSCMMGIASRAERLRIAKRVIRQELTDKYGKPKTGKDLLEWIKYAQSETDGVKIGIADIIADILTAFGQDDPPISTDGPGGNNKPDHDQGEQAG